MYAELHEYLLLNHELPLPGLGLFTVKRHPAVLDFPNRKFEGPGHSIEWKADTAVNARQLAAWLAANKGINDHEARHQLEKFSFQLKNGLAAGDTIRWKGIGVLTMKKPGEIGFVADAMTREGAVAANKVIREKAEHWVKVGEEERTAAQMTELLSKKKRKIALWIWVSSGLAILSLGFLIWYLGNHSWDLNAGNQAPAATSSPQEAGYKISP